MSAASSDTASSPSDPSTPVSDLLASRPDLAAQLKAAHKPLPSLTADLIPQLRILADEAETAKQLAAHRSNELADAHRTIETLRTKLARASRSISTLAASELALNRRLDFDNHVKSCVPTTIGGRSGLHPSTLDIHIEELPHSSHSDLACAPQIAWIPVVIWPFGLPGKPFTLRDGKTVTPIDIGSTTIRESLSLAHINIPSTRTTPAGPITTYTSQSYTLTGFARLSLNLTPPSDLQSRLDRRESRENWYASTDPSTPDSDQDSPAFIPSHQS